MNAIIFFRYSSIKAFFFLQQHVLSLILRFAMFLYQNFDPGTLQICVLSTILCHEINPVVKFLNGFTTAHI